MSCEALETRRLLSTINWVNRGDGTDSFDTVFGANDDLARAVVDAALDAWERVITNFQQDTDAGSDVTNPDTVNITLSMTPGTTGFGGGAGAPASYDTIDHPLARAITISSGNDTDGDGNGDGAGWYLDPNPADHAEFAGQIQNAFVGQATPGGPAAGLSDLYSLVTIEVTHALGITNFQDSGSPRWRTNNPFITDSGVADTIDNPGNLFTFVSGNISALLTANNGGPGGTDTTRPLHVARPQTGTPVAGFAGALDVGNASYNGGTRYLPSLLASQMLADVYGYTLAAGGADVFGTMHALLNSTNGNVLVRGMTGNNSNDVINISRSGSELVVSVDVGADVAGTGPTGALESRFNISAVNSITIDGLDGNDTITVSGDLSFLTGAVTITGDAGDDTLTLDFASGNPVPGAGLSFDGGSEPGSDLLVLQNGSFTNEIHSATGPSSGTISLDGTSNITYTNLAPIDDTLNVLNMTFNADLSAGDVVEIEDSPVAGRSRIRSANGTFELLDYANKTNLTLNGRGGGDSFNLTATVTAPGLATLTVNGGAGGDTFNVTTTRVPTTLNGDAGADTFNINGTRPGSTLTANGGGGADILNINDTGSGSTVVANGGDDGDTLSVAGTGSGAGTSVTVNGDAGGDIINVSGTGTTVTANGGAGDDTVNISGTGAGTTLTANGGNDADTVNVSGTGSGAGTVVAVNGNAGGDTVNVTGTGAASALTVNGDGGNDRVNVTGAGLAAGGTVQLNGNDDDDTFDVTSSPDVAIPVDGGGGNDTLKVNGQTLTYAFATASGTTTFTTGGRQPVTSVLVELLDVRNGTFTVTDTVDPNARVQGVEDGPATLNGTGTILGTLTADSGGTVSPAVGAAASGVLTSGSATLNAGSTFFVDLNGIAAGTLHDQLHVAGAATTVTINNANLAGTLAYTSVPGEELVIIRNDGSLPVSGKFLQGDLIEIGGRKFAIDYAFDGDGDGNANDVALIRYGAELHPDPCDPTKTALFVSATTGADNVLALPEAGSSRLRIVIEAVTLGFTDLFGPFDFDGHLIMMGQSGNDLVSSDAVPSRAVMLYGNVGNDRLVGGNNGGILLGNLGDDTLVGGNGRDLMIGGQGADNLAGNNAGDILVAASTAYDANTVANRQALCEIMDTWRQGGRMSTLLNAATVHDDAEVDVLSGGLGVDWFIRDLNDILDQTGNELISDL